MSVLVSSTKVIVNNPEKLKAILDSYEIEGLVFDIQHQEGTDTTTLEILNNEDDDDWPAAITFDDYCDIDDGPDSDSFFDALSDVFYEKGDEGLLALLLEVSSCIKSPLLIVAFTWPEMPGAKAWSVRPGDKSVEVVQVASW